ncbi:uncharacterized protein C8Q71DRAFT_778274 [Rhodofomes roseus]|uniref:Zn(2)-C6 fungal-type domain-containing protein n=1 Tax=Rhodofomes roseus TaxID=34475 RepID=A0ABQ8K5U1_9APHY|nr:uncharacterized protein C8Q71DRAFT_778274 [Rhodofomes roseus]KAH9832279.1 hypothetical protein C8Q71DRAFT_778274 [Rhodofomes roseus]
MDEFHIVFEAPQEGQAKKKRARLVTSCDHCRLKKIKCVQSRNSSKCEACSAARVACRFHDREQYFAERGRIMSRNSPPRGGRRGSQASVSIKDPMREHSSSPHSGGSSASSSDTHASSRYMAGYGYPMSESWASIADDRMTYIPPQPIWQAANDFAAPATFSSAPKVRGYHDPGLYGGSSDVQPAQQSYILPLFDPQCPDRPNATLMMHFIQTYFDHYGSFPCLAYDETVKQFLEQDLSPLIASGIAALAAWYSDLPEVVRRGAADVSAAYCSHAKALLSRTPQSTSLETLHGFILLALAEYKRARFPEYCSYVKKSSMLSDQLGLSDGSLLQTATTEYEQTVLRNTWSIVRQLVTTMDTWPA